VSAFLKVLEMNVRVFFQYRASFGISLVIFPIVLIVNVMLFESLYAYSGNDEIRGYSLTQMIWYFAAVPFVYVFIYNFAASRLSGRILAGELTMDFLRPLHIYYYEFAHAAASRIIGVSVEFLPTLFIYSLIYYPDFLTFASFFKFLIVAIFAFILMFQLNFIVGLTAFVLKENSAVSDIMNITLGLLGGAAVPLDFMPEAVQRVVQFLPFQYIFYEPLQYFLNQPDKAGVTPLLYTLLVQLIWIAALYVINRLIWAYFSKQFCAAGG